jgi:hypothetical protein
MLRENERDKIIKKNPSLTLLDSFKPDFFSSFTKIGKILKGPFGLEPTIKLSYFLSLFSIWKWQMWF